MILSKFFFCILVPSNILAFCIVQTFLHASFVRLNSRVNYIHHIAGIYQGKKEIPNIFGLFFIFVFLLLGILFRSYHEAKKTRCGENLQGHDRPDLWSDTGITVDPKDTGEH